MSDSRHIMLAVGLFLAVFVLGGATLVLPNVREIRQINDEVADLQFRSEGVDQTATIVEQLSVMTSEARDVIDTELKIIPNDPGIAAMIRRISLSIDGVNVLDQTFNVGSTAEPLPDTHPMIRGVPVTMQMKSTFESMYAVLRSIEAMDRMIRLRAIRIRLVPDHVNMQGDPIIETTLIVEAVYQEPPQG